MQQHCDHTVRLVTETAMKMRGNRPQTSILPVAVFPFCDHQSHMSLLNLSSKRLFSNTFFRSPFAINSRRSPFPISFCRFLFHKQCLQFCPSSSIPENLPSEIVAWDWLENPGGRLHVGSHEDGERHVGCARPFQSFQGQISAVPCQSHPSSSQQGRHALAFAAMSERGEREGREEERGSAPERGSLGGRKSWGRRGEMGVG